MGAGELEDALQTFSTLIKSHPEFTEAWNKRATVYFLLGRHHLNPNPSPNPNPNPDPNQATQLTGTLVCIALCDVLLAVDPIQTLTPTT